MEVMIDIPEIVADFLAQVMTAPGAALVAAVSGGPDSVCLLHALAGLRQPDSLRLIAAHFNHGIRGAEADADERYVGALCEQLHVPLLVERADVPALAERHKLSLEEAARRARYTFLAAVARRAGARYIAVAHNADDQVETVLMHFLRGSGLTGLRGMRPISPLSDYHLLEGQPDGLLLARPLLSVPRAEIEAYCAAHALEPRQDQSNFDTQYFRNRLRLELLPVLETYNPGVRQVMRRSAEVAAGDFDVVEAARVLAWRQVVRQETGQGLVFDMRAWRALPLGLQRMVLRQAVARLRPRLRDSARFDIIARALEVAQTGLAGAKATLPAGLLLHVSYDSLTLTSLHGRGPLPNHPVLLEGEILPVPAPGSVTLPDGEWELSAQVLGPGEWNAEAVRNNRDEWQAFIDRGALSGRRVLPFGDSEAAGGAHAAADPLPPLFLRTRRPGERFQPLGMTEDVRLTEFMINAKVPQVWRDAVPVLASGEQAERIVWLCGLRLDERVRVTERTQNIVHLRFEKS
jgi:tRNA(Ile)-lysidine synthase